MGKLKLLSDLQSSFSKLGPKTSQTVCANKQCYQLVQFTLSGFPSSTFRHNKALHHQTF